MDSKAIEPVDFLKADRSHAVVVDLREPTHFALGTIDGALNLPFSEIGRRLYDLPKDQTIYVFCAVGEVSEEVAEILSDAGYEAKHLSGGFRAYQRCLFEAHEETR